jgi:hypothetical protein
MINFNKLLIYSVQSTLCIFPGIMQLPKGLVIMVIWFCRPNLTFHNHIMPVHFDMESESIRNVNEFFSNRDFVSIIVC